MHNLNLSSAQVEPIRHRRRATDTPDTRTATEKIVSWLNDRDTVLFEAALAVNGAFNAFLTVTVDSSGHPIAPFMMSSLKYLSLDQNYWMLLLMIYSGMTMLALVHGQMTGNAYAIRSVVQVGGTMFQAIVAVAIFTSPMAPAAGLRYAITAIWTFLIAVVLIIKHDVRKKKHAARKGERGVS